MECGLRSWPHPGRDAGAGVTVMGFPRLTGLAIGPRDHRQKRRLWRPETVADSAPRCLGLPQTEEIPIGLRRRIWKEGANIAIEPARRFMAALSRHAAADHFGRQRDDGAALGGVATAPLPTVDRIGPPYVSLVAPRRSHPRLRDRNDGEQRRAGAGRARRLPPARSPARRKARSSSICRRWQSPWTKFAGKIRPWQGILLHHPRFRPGARPAADARRRGLSDVRARRTGSRALLPVALMLKPGFRLIIDKGAPTTAIRDLLSQRLLRRGPLNDKVSTA